MANITFTSDGGIDTSGPITSEGKNVLTTSDIYNGLDKLASGNALDARQGKVLNDKISAIISSSAVAEQGNKYIRYTNGLQICWGSFGVGDYSYSTNQWSSGYLTEASLNIPFPKAFNSTPIIVFSQGNSGTSHILSSYNCDASKIINISLWRPDSSFYYPNCCYIAIGGWK